MLVTSVAGYHEGKSRIEFPAVVVGVYDKLVQGYVVENERACSTAVEVLFSNNYPAVVIAKVGE